MNTPEIGKIYYHYKNKKPYTVIDTCWMHYDGIWHEAVLYVDDKHIKYARSLHNFCESFTEKPLD